MYCCVPSRSVCRLMSKCRHCYILGASGHIFRQRGNLLPIIIVRGSLSGEVTDAVHRGHTHNARDVRLVMSVITRLAGTKVDSR